MYGGQASLGRACADLFQQARLNTDCKINFPGVVGKAENIATQPSLAGAWAELGNISMIRPQDLLLNRKICNKADLKISYNNVVYLAISQVIW